MDKKTKSFFPYEKFRNHLKGIEEFESLSILSYGLTQQLLFKFPKKEVLAFSPPKPEKNQLSYGMGDVKAESAEMSCEWISLKECANRTGRSINEIINEASKGLIGPIQKHPETGEDIVVWPPEKRSIPPEQLPEPGKKTFKVKVSITAITTIGLDNENLDNFEQIQKTYLRSAHSIGKPEEVTDRAKEMLYRSCFLLRWTIFEEFLRNSIHELFRIHPRKLAYGNSAKKPSVSYEDIMNLSAEFTSVDSLREAIIRRQIEQSEAEGQSVHGLINLLKLKFGFYQDPYKIWYVLNGQKYESDYNSLLEIKEVRNNIVHNGGLVTDEFAKQFPNVPIRDYQIIINDTYNMKTQLIIASIAYNIAYSITRGKYQRE